MQIIILFSFRILRMFRGQKFLFRHKNLIGNRFVNLEIRPENIGDFHALGENAQTSRLDETWIFIHLKVVVNPLVKSDRCFESGVANIESFAVNAENRFRLFRVNDFDKVTDKAVNFIVGQAHDLKAFVFDKAKNRKAEIIPPAQKLFLLFGFVTQKLRGVFAVETDSEK